MPSDPSSVSFSLAPLRLSTLVAYFIGGDPAGFLFLTHYIHRHRRQSSDEIRLVDSNPGFLFNWKQYFQHSLSALSCDLTLLAAVARSTDSRHSKQLAGELGRSNTPAERSART